MNVTITPPTPGPSGASTTSRNPTQQPSGASMNGVNDAPDAVKLTRAEQIELAKSIPIVVPGVSEAGRRRVAQMEHEYQLDKTKISMLLPAIHGVAGVDNPYSSSSSTAASSLLFSELHDPSGDDEIRRRLEEQRVRFDKKLQLPLQVRLMELQGNLDVKKPAERFLKHIESGVPEVFGWTEQFQCPTPSYLKEHKSEILSRAASRRRLLGQTSTKGALSRHQRTGSTETRQSDTSPSISFAILPAHQLPSASSTDKTQSTFSLQPTDSRISLSLHDSTSNATLPAPAQSIEPLEYKSGHGYLTGSQTARQTLQLPQHAHSTASLSSSSSNLPTSASSQTLPGVNETEPNSTDKSKRWGGTTSTATITQDDTRLVAMKQRRSSTQLLPELGKARFQQSVISIAADAKDGRSPNYYTPATDYKPFISTTFGYGERETMKDLSRVEDTTGPYSQSMNYGLMCQHVARHVPGPQFRHSQSALPLATSLGSKLETSIYAVDRAALDLESFRKSTLQPLANSDILGPSTAIDVQGHGFNLATALGGLLAGGGLAASGYGINGQTTLRADYTPKKMDVGPGSYFIGLASTLATQKHISVPSYGPAGFNESEARHSYILNLGAADNPAPWKYQSQKKTMVQGAPIISRMSGRSNPFTTALKTDAIDVPPPGQYNILQFPDKATSSQINIGHSEWGFQPRFPQDSRQQKESHTQELKRLMNDTTFKGLSTEYRFKNVKPRPKQQTTEEKDNKAVSAKSNSNTSTSKHSPSHSLENTTTSSNGNSQSATISTDHSTQMNQMPASLDLSPTQQPQPPPPLSRIDSASSNWSSQVGSELPSPATATEHKQQSSATGPRAPVLKRESSTERAATFAAQLAAFGTFQVTPEFLAAQAALRAVRQAAVESQRHRLGGGKGGRKDLPAIQPQPPASMTGSAKDPATYAKSLGQFSRRNQLQLRKQKKAAREERMLEVLSTHRDIVHQKLGIYQERINQSNALHHARMTKRAGNARWFEMIALFSRLRLWVDLLKTRRVYLVLNQRRDEAARKIQMVWHHHQNRIQDAKREISMRTLRRNFHVLFFRRRVRRRIKARQVLLAFFRDVLREEDSESAKAVAASEALEAEDPAAGATPAPVVTYRRGTVNSVVAVIRHFKTQIKMIQRAVRRYFLLRDAQIEILCRQWDVVYERQRKLYNDFSRRYKMMDSNSLAEQAVKDHTKFVHQQQILLNKLEQQQKAAQAAATALAAANQQQQTSNASDVASSSTANPQGRKKGRAKSPIKRTNAAAANLAHIVVDEPSSKSGGKNHPQHAHSAPPEMDGPLTSTPSPTRTPGADEEEHVTDESNDTITVELLHIPATSHSTHPSPIDESKSGRASPVKSGRSSPISKASASTATPNPTSTGLSKPHARRPAPPASSSQDGHRRAATVSLASGPNASPVAAEIVPAASLLPPVPVFPQIFQWDKKFTDAERRVLLIQDWKERRMKFAKKKMQYLAEEEAYIKEQCRGLTAAKRLLRLSATNPIGPSLENMPLGDDGLVSRAIAQARFRELNPCPTFHGLLNQQQMIKLMNQCLTNSKKQRKNQPRVSIFLNNSRAAMNTQAASTSSGVSVTPEKSSEPIDILKRRSSMVTSASGHLNVTGSPGRDPRTSLVTPSPDPRMNGGASTPTRNSLSPSPHPSPSTPQRRRSKDSSKIESPARI